MSAIPPSSSNPYSTHWPSTTDLPERALSAEPDSVDTNDFYAQGDQCNKLETRKEALQLELGSVCRHLQKLEAVIKSHDPEQQLTLRLQYESRQQELLQLREELNKIKNELADVQTKFSANQQNLKHPNKTKRQAATSKHKVLMQQRSTLQDKQTQLQLQVSKAEEALFSAQLEKEKVEKAFFKAQDLQKCKEELQLIIRQLNTEIQERRIILENQRSKITAQREKNISTWSEQLDELASQPQPNEESQSRRAKLEKQIADEKGRLAFHSIFFQPMSTHGAEPPRIIISSSNESPHGS